MVPEINIVIVLKPDALMEGPGTVRFSAEVELDLATIEHILGYAALGSDMRCEDGSLREWGEGCSPAPSTHVSGG